MSNENLYRDTRPSEDISSESLSERSLSSDDRSSDDVTDRFSSRDPSSEELSDNTAHGYSCCDHHLGGVHADRTRRYYRRLSKKQDMRDGSPFSEYPTSDDTNSRDTYSDDLSSLYPSSDNQSDRDITTEDSSSEEVFAGDSSTECAFTEDTAHYTFHEDTQSRNYKIVPLTKTYVCESVLHQNLQDPADSMSNITDSFNKPSIIKLHPNLSNVKIYNASA